MVEDDDRKIVRVRMKVGDVEVEVECDVSEVGSVVDRILAVVAEHVGVGDGIRGSGVGGIGVGRGETCKGLIVNLWEDSWFNVGQGLSDVHGELGRRGFHYDRTAVAHALVDLVREGVLTRVGRARRYRYLQKRPPPAIKKTKVKAEKE